MHQSNIKNCCSFFEFSSKFEVIADFGIHNSPYSLRLSSNAFGRAILIVPLTSTLAPVDPDVLFSVLLDVVLELYWLGCRVLYLEF